MQVEAFYSSKGLFYMQPLRGWVGWSGVVSAQLLLLPMDLLGVQIQELVL